MSAPTPAPGDDRPRAGYYPDPSIPGWVRYWNGAAWVPGSSRPAPADGEVPEPLAATTQSVPPVEETGPHFFDEDPPRPGSRVQHGSRPEPAPAWNADSSRQGGGRVTWGTAPAPDPRTPAGPPSGPAAGDTAPDAGTGPGGGSAPGAGSGPGAAPVPSGPAFGPGTAVPGPAPAPGAPAAASAPPPGPASGGPGPAAGEEAGERAAAARTGQAPGGQEPAGRSPAGRAAAGEVPLGRPAPGPDAADPAPSARAPQAQPLAGQAPMGQHPFPQPPLGRPAPSVPPPAAPAPPVTPVIGGDGGGQSSWAQQVHRLARGGEETPPVIPWRPPVEDVFEAEARRRASARPAALGRRLAARLLDTAVVGAVTAVAAVPLGVRAVDHVQAKIDAAKLSGRTVTVWLLDGTTSVYLGIVLAVLLLSGVVYEALPTARWGRTLGKRLVGLEVRDIELGEPPSFGAALRRWLVYCVPGLLAVGLVGVLWALFDKPWRQCWHDKAAHTFVAG